MWSQWPAATYMVLSKRAAVLHFHPGWLDSPSAMKLQAKLGG